MSTHTPEPTIRVNVDPSNPGQFFACCGLLELSDRLYGDCCGRFEYEQFQLHGSALPASPDVVIADLMQIPEFAPEITKKIAIGGSKSKLIPISITVGDQGPLRLDWWRDESKPPSKKSANETCSSSKLKTWAANQSPQQIIYDRLLPALRKLNAHANLFHARIPIAGRFGFDPIAASVPLDAGWSPDSHDIPVATSPAVEMLAAIGLQRFRPQSHSTLKRMFLYATWTEFLPPSIAAAACAGAFPEMTSKFQFSLGSRGDYKHFEYATPVENFDEHHPQ